MSEASQVTVEQLLMQQKLRDEEILFLRKENRKINIELQASRILNKTLMEENKRLFLCSLQSIN